MSNSINSVKVQKDKNYCVISIEDEIVSPVTSIKLKEVLEELIKKEKFYQIILDLSQLKFIESSMIGVIVESYKSLIMINGKMNIVIKAKAVYERFEVSQLDKLLRIYDDLQDAIKACK